MYNIYIYKGFTVTRTRKKRFFNTRISRSSRIICIYELRSRVALPIIIRTRHAHIYITRSYIFLFSANSTVSSLFLIRRMNRSRYSVVTRACSTVIVSRKYDWNASPSSRYVVINYTRRLCARTARKLFSKNVRHRPKRPTLEHRTFTGVDACLANNVS